MQYQNVPFDTLENIQPNAVLKINLDNPNEIYWINLGVESAAKDQYLAWLAQGNTPTPADEP